MFFHVSVGRFVCILLALIVLGLVYAVLKPRDWLGRTSRKCPILCRVGRKTSTQSILTRSCPDFSAPPCVCVCNVVDWRLSPLVQFVKHWAKVQGINDASQGTVSSYSLVLMVVHYLQCKLHVSILSSSSSSSSSSYTTALE